MRMCKFVLSVMIVTVFGLSEALAVDQSVCNPGSHVALYPNGSLMSCVLKNDFRYGDITCKELLPISFYDDGKLERCSLAEKATMGDQVCKELESISFYPNGKFKACVKSD